MHRTPAASPSAGEAAALMSARHGWLRFISTGTPLPVRLSDDVRPWQDELLDGHRHWYGRDAPVQVAGAFVLQYLLQIPANTAAFAAGIGMRPARLADLTFGRGENGVPRLVEIGELTPFDGDLDERLGQAERDYRHVGEELAAAYRSIRPMSSRQRMGMVTDMWADVVPPESWRASFKRLSG